MSKKILKTCPKCKMTLEFRKDQVTCGRPECKKLPTFGQAPLVVTEKDNVPCTAIQEQAKKLLLGKKISLVDLANQLNIAPKHAHDAVKQLQDAGHMVNLEDGSVGIQTQQEPGNHLVIDAKSIYTGTDYKFGLLGDTHLYSKYSREDALAAMYDLYVEEGITTVFHTGNIVEGECRFNRFDLKGPSGIGPALDYCANEYPHRKGITTKFVTGEDHEGWWIQREGLNIGRAIEDAAKSVGRSDLEFIGHIETDVHIQAKEGSAWMKVMHPGGGSSYAISYTEQKLVESFQGGEKPQIFALGHHHKFNHGYPREVHTVQTGCFQDQTPFLRRLKIQVHVGGTIVKFHQAPTGEISRFSVEFMPFYDRGYYTGKDKYKRY